MSRSEIKPRISLEEVKSRWYETYSKYMSLSKEHGGFKSLCCVHSEKTPSFNVFGNGAFKCYGCGISGGGIVDFIMIKERLSFTEAINFIIKDNNITSRERTIIPVLKKESVLIEANTCRFERRHRDYWNKYLLPESYLKDQDVYAISKLAFNKKIQDINNETVFGYYAKDIDKWKILRIGEHITKKDKWRNNVPLSYLWSFPLNHVKDLWIVKSRKDSLVMNYHFGLRTTATQNEDGIFLLEHNYKRIEDIADRKIINFGADFQGWHESLLITEYTGWNYFNTPCNLEGMGIVDPADLVDEMGLEPLKQLLIKKNYI